MTRRNHLYSLLTLGHPQIRLHGSRSNVVFNTYKEKLNMELLGWENESQYQ